LDDLYSLAQEVYEDGLNIGVPKELARLSVPVARYSRMRASANLRNWIAFLTLRQSPKAQLEIREYANAVGEFIAELFPKTWDLYLARQIEKVMKS
jgi:thymidylate synthase (FAD)